jgi:predicted GH43/DUF377 family glycosyl hydrolase
MIWEKLGHTFVAESQRTWMVSHAANPKVLQISGSIFRVFFAVRDAFNRSHIAFIDIDILQPQQILAISEQPVLSPGPNGVFDDAGVLPASIVRIKKGIALYYIGISLAQSTPFQSFAGVAILDDRSMLASRVSRAPMLDRSEEDPFSGGSVCVLFDEQRLRYEMWYESCGGWKGEGSLIESSNALKYAVSEDGVKWARTGQYCVPSKPGEEYVSAPSVLWQGTKYGMWYSLKREGRYRIGYAESLDAINWDRLDDQVGISPSGSGWDGIEIEYPEVFEYQKDTYMFYNGNRFGETGFGLARLRN